MLYNPHLNLLLKTLHTSLNKQLLGSFAQRYGQSWDWKMNQQPFLATIFETNQETVALETCWSGQKCNNNKQLKCFCTQILYSLDWAEHITEFRHMPEDGITYKLEVKMCLSVLLCMGLHYICVCINRKSCSTRHLGILKCIFVLNWNRKFYPDMKFRKSLILEIL